MAISIYKLLAAELEGGFPAEEAAGAGLCRGRRGSSQASSELQG